MHDKVLKLQDVWRTCNKIRAAIFRIKNLKLVHFFKEYDPQGNCLITESQFLSVFTGPLAGPIGLTDQEISDLADYFRVQDGRIFYTQLCEVIDNAPKFEKNEPLVTGLEWEDPLQVNRLSITEERRVCLLLTKIAATVNIRRIVLRPYFQDYELISKNYGTVTITHFARILAFLNILVSSDDFNLLLKKYMKDGYTINYIAFLKAIDEIVQYLNEHKMLDVGGDIHELFPGRIINAELPKLPRPEIGKILASTVFGKETVFHSALKTQKEQEDLLTVMRRIQKHVYSNRIRIYEFFRDYDLFNCGRCTISQFRRALDLIGISGIDRLYLSEPEIHSILIQYQDPVDLNRLFWITFMDDIDTVFTTKQLEKLPEYKVVSPSAEIEQLPRVGGKDWQNVNGSLRDLCEEVTGKIKNRVLTRRILLKPSFKDYDKHNNGHVSRSQMRQCILSNGILLSNEELYALEQRFNDDVGFNYFWFLNEVEPKPYEVPLVQGLIENIERLNAPKQVISDDPKESDIVLILAKIKGKVARERTQVFDFLRDHDKSNEFVIKRADFKRALSICNFDLTDKEVETIMDVFASPLRPNCVDYRRFSEVVEEVFTQAGLERAPLIVPLQHIPTKDCYKNFLNYEERQVASMALDKLAKHPDMIMNFIELFKSKDLGNCGTISRGQFVNALTVRGMNNLISSHEFDIICKCFGFERGLRNEVDYRAFCKAIDILFNNSRQKPF